MYLLIITPIYGMTSRRRAVETQPPWPSNNLANASAWDGSRLRALICDLRVVKGCNQTRGWEKSWQQELAAAS